ncbi:sulfotransferase family cytosolic 1B member 1-like [Cimex lectularius]|uniref:Sulfotransferase domain-containing protein n=1 Tax=Cimex lectularius TaxID=79782 RepID=A0A8I6RI64_CIMLE|nr:sulfotransferase family cytosolic 1B member 1-like [Cimex lectularius]XP_014245582.1 sulfotransferase family cytosolic 1B member 1-like [Cimex lectularius]XP_014245583.1 sulfotransferase family cytosolic 1B member 1-like [Cimex lectularius]
MFPYKIIDLEDSMNKQLMSHFDGERTGFCQVGPKKWLLPAAYKQHAEQYYTMPIKKDDVWIITFPRSGTTLCQELVWMVNNNFDYEKSGSTTLDRKFPFYEFSILHHIKFHEEVNEMNNNDPKVAKVLAYWREHGYKTFPDLPSPRHIKTHLPFSLLPQDLVDTCKSIYVARNAKDVAVSYYHHNKLLKLHGYVGDFQQYWDYFEKDLLVYSPYFEHVKEGWERRNHPNVLFIYYENIVKDLKGSIKKIADFLNKPASEEDVERLAQHLEINNFRKNVKIHEDIEMKGMTNPDAEGFIRSGKTGDKKEFTDELAKKADNWILENLKNTDILFPGM